MKPIGGTLSWIGENNLPGLRVQVNGYPLPSASALHCDGKRIPTTSSTSYTGDYNCNYYILSSTESTISFTVT